MPEDGKDVSVTQGEVKTYTGEDILAGADTREVLGAYRRAVENPNLQHRRSELQTMVADRLTDLGNDLGAVEFTVLAGQTRNTEENARTAEMIFELNNLPLKLNGALEAAVDSFKTVVNRLAEPAEMVGNAASRIGQAATSMDESSRRLSSAADSIDESSRRMNR